MAGTPAPHTALQLLMWAHTDFLKFNVHCVAVLHREISVGLCIKPGFTGCIGIWLFSAEKLYFPDLVMIREGYTNYDIYMMLYSEYLWGKKILSLK